MLEFFARFDRWVLEHIAEPISWRLEALTGLNNFQQSRGAILVYFVGNLVQDFFSRTGVKPFLLVMLLIIVAVQYAQLLWYERMSLKRSMRTALFDPAQVIWRAISWVILLGITWQLGLTTMTLLSIEVPWEKWDIVEAVLQRLRILYPAAYVSGIAGLLYSYFLACHPKPPWYERKLVPAKA